MALTAGPARIRRLPAAAIYGPPNEIASAGGYFPIFGSPRRTTPYDLRRMLIRQGGSAA